MPLPHVVEVGLGICRRSVLSDDDVTFEPLRELLRRPIGENSELASKCDACLRASGLLAQFDRLTLQRS